MFLTQFYVKAWIVEQRGSKEQEIEILIYEQYTSCGKLERSVQRECYLMWIHNNRG